MGPGVTGLRLSAAQAVGVLLTELQAPAPDGLVRDDHAADTGLVRLSYGQARMLLDEHTALGGTSGTGWDLHEWRHPGLTHPGEAGASLLMLMAKSRHKKPENVRKYFRPSADAITEVTSLLAPGDSRR